MQILTNPWLLASRPKTLTAAFVPVYLATMLAKKDGAAINWEISFYAFLTAIFVQLGTNLVNDALDFKKGADTDQRLGPVRATQSGLLTYKQVLFGAMICFSLALVFGIPLMTVGGTPLFFLLLSSVICGYLYTGGPYPLAYVGLGDLFVLLYFGFAATGAVYFLQYGALTYQSLIAGAQAGLLATVLIAVNNMRDIDADQKANKKTLPVRFGITFGRFEVTLLMLTAFSLNFYWLSKKELWAAALPLLALPVACALLKGVWTHPPGRIYNQYLGMAALVHLLAGTLLGIGLVLS